METDYTIIASTLSVLADETEHDGQRFAETALSRYHSRCRHRNLVCRKEHLSAHESLYVVRIEHLVAHMALAAPMCRSDCVFDDFDVCQRTDELERATICSMSGMRTDPGHR